MLTGRHGARTFARDTLRLSTLQLTYQGGLGSGWRCQRWDAIRVGGNESRLARIPPGEQFCGRRTANQAWMGQPGELDPLDMPRHCIDALQIPDGFFGLRIVLGEETTTVCFRKNTGETPGRRDKSTNIENIDDQNVSRLCPLDGNGPAQIMHLR